MSDDDQDAKVLVFRNADGQPVVVPADVAYDADRAYRAYRKHIGGMEWSQVAAEEGYPNARAASADVALWKHEAAALVADKARREMLETEVARLNALQAAHWPAAMAGNVTSAKFCLDVIITRMRALEIGAKDAIDADSAATARTVVVGGDDYRAALERAAQD